MAWAPAGAAAPRCELGKLVRFVALEKGGIDDETLRQIANSALPINPMTHDESMGHLQRHVFESAFAKHLEAGVTPEEWAEVREDALRILAQRHGQAEVRAVVAPQVSWLPAPRTIKEWPSLSAGTGRLRSERLLSHLADGQLTFGPIAFQMGALYRLDLATGALGRLPEYPESGSIVALIQQPGGKPVTVSTECGDKPPALIVFDSATGTELARHDSRGYYIDYFTPKTAYYRADGSLVMLTLPQLKRTQKQFDSRLKKWSTPPLPVIDAQASLDGRRIFGAVVEKQGIWPLTKRTLKLSLVDLATGKKVLERPLGLPASEAPERDDGEAAKLAIKEKPDGTLLAAFRLRNKVFIFDGANESRVVLDLPEGEYRNLGLEIGKDGRVFFVADRTTKHETMQMAIADVSLGGMQFFNLPAQSRAVITFSTPEGKILRLYESPAKTWLSQVFGPAQ